MLRAATASSDTGSTTYSEVDQCMTTYACTLGQRHVAYAAMRCKINAHDEILRADERRTRQGQRIEDDGRLHQMISG